MSKRTANKQPQFLLKPACAVVLLAFTIQTAQANPIGPSVINGQASFATAGNALTVTNTPGAIINWQGFSIGANEITRFAQQSASSAVLNRVISNNPSSILGALQSNGRVFLVNPNGIVFGQGATINVAGLVATTLNLSNADFLAGRYNFTDVPGAQNISNVGNLTAHGDGQGGGQVYLIAPNVENTGIINAPNGEILLAAGHSVELVNSNDPSLRVNITAPAGDATNVGQLIASSGSLGLFGTVVRNSGQVSADSAVMQGGRIVFKAIQRTEISGTVSANGSTGGTIQALGNQVGVMDGATVTANGTQGGGTVLIGGDYQGKSTDVPNAQVTYVAPTASISANATQNGNGGKIIVWADDATRAYGSLSARGGALSGNGGFIETSGKQYLDVAGIRVSTAAPNGTTGNWLLDPTDITISHSTLAINAGLTVAGNTSTISDFDINTALATTNITISTTSGGSGTGFIQFDAAGGAITISNSSTAARTLQLNAENDIKFVGGATTFASPSSTSVLDVGFSPVGKVTTAAGSSVTLDGNFGLTRAWVALAKTWENSGTLSINGNAAFHIEHNYGAGASTLHNMSGGIVNVASTAGWAIWSNGCCQDGILINDGTINVTSSTAFEAAYSQSSSGTLNIADTKFLNLQNAIALSGGINLNATGALNINENHGTAATLSNLTFSGTGGTLLVASGFNGTKIANLTNVSAPNVALTVGGGGTINVINGDAVFKTVSLPGGTIGAMTNGTLGITSGNFTIPTGITYTGNIGYSATGNLIVSSPINTTGNVTLNSDSDGTGGGNIQITSSIVSNGGNITLAGGINGAGAAAGASTASSAVATGVYLSGASVNAGGGNIAMRGTGMAGTSFGADGIYITSNSVVQTSGAGTITLNGTGGAGGAGSSFNSGVRFGTGAQLSSVNGAITINGQGGAGNNGSNYGVYVHNGATLTSTGSGTITLNGTGASTGTGNAGVRVSASAGATKIASASGAIAITGQGGAGGDGLQIVSGATVQSTAGTLSLNGTSGSGAGVSGVYINLSTVSAGVASVNANSFTLNGGTWNQVSATLPVFNVGNFSIVSGAFIRALGGNGSIATPYLLTDIYGVQGMGSIPTSSFALANNVNAAGTVNWNVGAGFLPVGNATTNFTGTFDGQSHTISSLTINRPTTNDVGLFGVVGAAGAVDNVGLVGGSVTGGTSVGGLVGYNYGSISNSYSSGMTVSGRNVGGLAGENSGTITNTYSGGGSVGSLGDIGGLVGDNWNIINNSYSTNVVVGNGGLIGWNEISSVNNYWDTQTSGRATSSGPEIGLTTAQMKTMSSFAGWSIANTGGAGAVWRIYEGQTYPLLTSFLAPLTVTANAAARTYDGLAYSGGNGVTYSVAGPVLYGMLAYTGTSQGAINAGSYIIAPTGLFSNQQGYDISYVDGTLTINPAPAPAPAPTTTSFLPDLVNTMLIPGGGASGSSQSTIGSGVAPPVVVVNGEIPPTDNAPPLPVCPL